MVVLGLLPASELPRRSENTGSATATITSSATTALPVGRACTFAAQRDQKPVACTSDGPCSASCLRWARLSTFSFSIPSMAGSRVIAASTVSATVSAAETAIPLRKPMPRISMPSRAITTVRPANSTARPEVFSALATESCTLRPAIRPLRWRFTMNSA